MAIQVLPRNPVSDEIAQNFATSIASPLQMLAQNKLGQIQQRHQQRQTFQNLQMLGLTPEQAHGIAGMPADIQKDLISRYFGEQGFGGLQAPAEAVGKGVLEKPRRLSPKEAKEQALADKETKADYDSIIKAREASKSANTRLSRMQQLIEKGSLPISTLYNLFNTLEKAEGWFAIPAKAAAVVGKGIQRGITSRDTEEFEKLSADFVKDAKNFFGPRLTDADLAAYMQTIPTLANTDAGKLRLVENLKTFNRINELKYEAAKNIIKANGGRRPANFKLLVDEAVAPEIDALAEEFKLRS